MAFGANTPWLWRTLATALAIALLLALGSSASPSIAQAGTACTKFGDKKMKQLKKGQARASVRCFINRKRKRKGLPKLSNHRRLQRASQRHTNVMINKGCFAHQCPGEASLESRLRSVSYLIGGLTSWAYAENIAYGGGRYGTPKAIVRAWMKSPGHRANILSSSYRDIGVGVRRGLPGRSGADAGTYTTDFGRRVG